MVLPVSIETLFGSRLATIVPCDAHIPLAGWTRYTLLDRGSYDFVDNIAVPPIVIETASKLAGRALAVVEARALRLVPGDYLLAHHDTIHDDHPIEVVLDLSPRAVPAEVHYRRRGQVFFRMPCEPGTLAVVERGPTVTRNHTYVSKLHRDAEVLRIVALLR